MKKITVTKTQVKQLIAEEATRYRKILELQKRKSEILRQLNEMYQNDYMMETMPGMEEEAFMDLFKKDDPIQKKEEIKQFIRTHNTYSKFPKYWAQQTGKSEEELLDKLADFFVKEGVVIVDGMAKGLTGGFTYNPATGEFMNKTQISAPYGPTSGKGEI